MPLYEYYCQSCDGIYEAIRPMREASLPVPCPQCNRDGQRVMSSFTAFTFRDGYPRRIPDKGTYWHFGREVKKPATRMVGMEHPELAEPESTPRPTKGAIEEQQEMWLDRQAEMGYRDKEGVGLYEATLPKARKVRKPRTKLTPSGRSEERKGED